MSSWAKCPNITEVQLRNYKLSTFLSIWRTPRPGPFCTWKDLFPHFHPPPSPPPPPPPPPPPHTHTHTHTQCTSAIYVTVAPTNWHFGLVEANLASVTVHLLRYAPLTWQSVVHVPISQWTSFLISTLDGYRAQPKITLCSRIRKLSS